MVEHHNVQRHPLESLTWWEVCMPCPDHQDGYPGRIIQANTSKGKAQIKGSHWFSKLQANKQYMLTDLMMDARSIIYKETTAKGKL
jgi:hypothetical protein